MHLIFAKQLSYPCRCYLENKKPDLIDRKLTQQNIHGTQRDDGVRTCLEYLGVKIVPYGTSQREVLILFAGSSR